MANRLANPVPLKVVPFTNPSGATVYRVTGTHHGERVRKNFPDETAAQIFLNKHIATHDSRPPAPIITSLAARQVREAEAATLRLPPNTTLLQAVDFFAEHHRPLVPMALLDDEKKTGAITAFTHWLDTQRKNELVTILQRESVLKHFATETRTARTDAISVARASAWIYAAAGTRTQRDRFDLLNFFCEFLVRRKHLAANPVAELDRPVHKVRVPAVLTFDETWTLLQCALTDAEGPEMLPWFAVCALSGVRPDEAQRLTWANFYMEDEHRIIEVNAAKGGRSRRNVPISDPLWRILSWAKARELAPGSFSRRKFRRIRRRAGLESKWEKDLLRHTFASHRYVIDKDTTRLAGDMGNSERVLFQNYLRPVPLADGVRFQGLALHYSVPREKSAMGSGPKPRKSRQPV